MRKPFLSVIFIIIIVGILRAEVDIDSLIQNSPAPSDYPEAGACILLSEETDSVLEDGGFIKEIHRIIKIFDYRGKKEYSNVKVRYNRDKEKVDLLFARTYRTDGTVAEIDSGAINEITPAGFGRAGIYADIKTLVFSLPSVEDSNSIVEYSYRISSIKPPEEGYFSTVFFFRSHDPILHLRYRVSTLPDRALLISLHNGAKEPVKIGSGYLWEIDSIPGYIPEENSPPKSCFLPNVYVTTAADWGTLGKMLLEKFDEASAGSPEIASKVTELSKGKSREEAIKSIYFFVTSLRSVKVLDYGDGSYFPNPAADVLKNGYGDTKDKSVLLYAMLKELGVPVQIVLVNSRCELVDTTIPSLKQFNRVIVGVDENLFLDPLAEYSPYPYLGYLGGNKLFLLGREKKGFLCIPEFAPDVNRVSVDIKVKLDTLGDAEVSFTAFPRGYFDSSVREKLFGQKSRKKKMLVSKSLSSFGGGAKLVDYTVSAVESLDIPISFTVNFRKPDFVRWEKDIGILTLPGEFPFFHRPWSLSLDTREFPMMLPTNLSWNIRWEVEFPERFSLEYFSDSSFVSNELGSFTVSGKNVGNKVILEYTFTVFKRYIKPKEYSSLRELNSKFSLPKNNLILFEKR